eukprot:2589275-Pleurochrysis_carterae.AAC.2
MEASQAPLRRGRRRSDMAPHGEEATRASAEFTQSEFDPCYCIYKQYSDDGHHVDLVLYVDDCWIADTGGAQADNDLRIFQDRYKLTLQDKPKQFSGIHIEMGDDGSVKIFSSAYVKAEAETYLPKPLDEYPLYVRRQRRN